MFNTDESMGGFQIRYESEWTKPSTGEFIIDPYDLISLIKEEPPVKSVKQTKPLNIQLPPDFFKNLIKSEE
jgi:hypothetical protein